MSSFEIVIRVLFWLSIGGVAYAYLGYPIAVWALAAAFGRRRESPGECSAGAPFVSVLIVAHNEEDVIAARLENALNLDYAPDRVEIIVASDGSTDRTVDIAGRTGDPRVRVLDFHRQRGKAAVLNDVMPELKGDIVVLSDANTFLESAAVRRFIPWFHDARVGVVVGRLVLTDPATARNVDSLYWRYETFLKQMDARLNALLGANGAIYAIRRSLFVPLPDKTLVDDLVLPLLIRLRTGHEIVYDSAIVGHELTPADLRSEFKRRRRIGAGGFQSLTVLWPLLSPARGWIAFTFVSHKVLRWVCPFLLAGAMAANAFLLDQGVYRLVLYAQGVLYGVAAAGAFAPGKGAAVRLVRLAWLFTSMNAALLLGFWQFAAGVRGGTWDRTARALATQPATGSLDDSRLTDSTIRVVHLVNALEIGGLEMVVANLARQIRRRFQLHVICLEGLGPIASRLAYAGVPVECIGHPQTSVARSVIDLRRRLKALRPDVVHTHNEKAHIRGALATLGWSAPPALVHTRHGRSRVTGWAARLANRVAVWRSGYIVSVSEDASAIPRLEGAGPKRVRVIRNGVDVDTREGSRYQAGGRMRAVAVGRLTPVKDFHTMLRATRIVADTHADFHLDVVGDGPSRPGLEALRRDLRLERHVTFHGAADDVRGFLAAATLFVQSSLSEGISLTLLEAMAAGLPIVATRVGGTPEVVEQGLTGILVAPQDPEGLARSMLTVLNARGLAESMSRSARHRALTSFSLRQMTASYEALYEEALVLPGVVGAKECHVSL
jgi:glycosyltransferase involved in cell wall biosynthesis/cellulose synthase/poly-beta-1,6-N-acetylglucosamine synthase-like glycosyltransferase